MKIKFITSFANDRECYGTGKIHDLTNEQAIELVRLGIATVETPEVAVEEPQAAPVAVQKQKRGEK